MRSLLSHRYGDEAVDHAIADEISDYLDASVSFELEGFEEWPDVIE